MQSVKFTSRDRRAVPDLGHGMPLIKEALVYEIPGSVTTLRFLDHGLRCDIAIPRPLITEIT